MACDIGAGSGRDANWLARQGWEVVAVEPSRLLEKGELQSHENVMWLDDALPSLKKLRARRHRFDLILLSGVWQHVRQDQRERVFRILTDLLNPSGLLVVSLRHSEDQIESAERGIHPVDSGELVHLGRQRALISHDPIKNQPDLAGRDIRWEWQIFEMPDDGTGNLPLLRHIIVNDNKSSSYKLGLLRTLVKLAEMAPGIADDKSEDFVEIPFGAVALFWIKLYRSFVLDRDLRQHPSRLGYGFAKDAFKQLKHISPNDLALGAGFDADRANTVRQAIADTCETIQRMPANYITKPGRDSEKVFECEREKVSKHTGGISLSHEYLRSFGVFRIPTQLWQSLGQYACWIEPAIVREWRRLILPWQSNTNAETLSFIDQAFEWPESNRETNYVSNRAKKIRGDGFPLSWAPLKTSIFWRV